MVIWTLIGMDFGELFCCNTSGCIYWVKEQNVISRQHFIKNIHKMDMIVFNNLLRIYNNVLVINIYKGTNITNIANIYLERGKKTRNKSTTLDTRYLGGFLSCTLKFGINRKWDAQ